MKAVTQVSSFVISMVLSVVGLAPIARSQTAEDEARAIRDEMKKFEGNLHSLEKQLRDIQPVEQLRPEIEKLEQQLPAVQQQLLEIQKLERQLPAAVQQPLREIQKLEQRLLLMGKLPAVEQQLVEIEKRLRDLQHQKLR